MAWRVWSQVGPGAALGGPGCGVVRTGGVGWGGVGWGGMGWCGAWVDQRGQLSGGLALANPRAAELLGKPWLCSCSNRASELEARLASAMK